MYSISLLPSEYKSYLASSRKKELSIMILSVVVVALALILFMVTLISNIYDKGLESLEGENAVIENRIENYLYIESLQAQMLSLDQQILQIGVFFIDWGSVITEIGNTVPKRIGLESITIGSSDSLHIMIRGHARSHEDVSEWMKKIGTMSGLQSVQCRSLLVDDNSGLISFELDIPLLTADDTAAGGAN
jgi:Tfp pilus assembly protein PilN